MGLFDAFRGSRCAICGEKLNPWNRTTLLDGEVCDWHTSSNVISVLRIGANRDYRLAPDDEREYAPVSIDNMFVEEVKDAGETLRDARAEAQRSYPSAGAAAIVLDWRTIGEDDISEKARESAYGRSEAITGKTMAAVVMLDGKINEGDELLLSHGGVELPVHPVALYAGDELSALWRIIDEYPTDHIAISGSVVLDRSIEGLSVGCLLVKP